MLVLNTTTTDSIKEEIIKKSYLYTELTRSIDKLEIQMNQEIDRIRIKYEKKLSLSKNKLKLLAKEIKNDVSLHKSAIFMDNKRSIDLPSIVVGFRKSTELVIPLSERDNIIRYLEDNHFTECLEIKKSIRKSVLALWDDELLSKIGVIRKQKDNFYIDIKTEQL